MRSHLPKAVPLIWSVLLFGCGGGDPPPPPPAEPVPMPQAYEPAESDYLFSGNTAVIATKAEVVIQDPATLGRYWREATEAQRNPAPVPTIDFTRDLVVFLAAGQKTQGARIQVDRIGFDRQSTPDGGSRRIMEIFATVESPCSAFPGASYPVQLVRVQKTDMEIRFEVTERECSGRRPT